MSWIVELRDWASHTVHSVLLQSTSEMYRSAVIQDCSYDCSISLASLDSRKVHASGMRNRTNIYCDTSFNLIT